MLANLFPDPWQFLPHLYAPLMTWTGGPVYNHPWVSHLVSQCTQGFYTNHSLSLKWYSRSLASFPLSNLYWATFSIKSSLTSLFKMKINPSILLILLPCFNFLYCTYHLILLFVSPIVCMLHKSMVFCLIIAVFPAPKQRIEHSRCLWICIDW